MSKKIKDVVVKTGSYDVNGETKGRYENVGVLMQAEDGSQYALLKRTFNPAGVINPDNRESVTLSFFDPKAKG